MRWVLLSLSLLICSCRSQIAAETEPASTWAFDNVSVVDVRAGEILSDQTVVIEGSSIASVGSAPEAEASASAHRIDGSGKYLLPDGRSTTRRSRANPNPTASNMVDYQAARLLR